MFPQAIPAWDPRQGRPGGIRLRWRMIRDPEGKVIGSKQSPESFDSPQLYTKIQKLFVTYSNIKRY